MTAVRGFFGHLGFVWNRNLWRLLLALVVLTALIASSGTVAICLRRVSRWQCLKTIVRNQPGNAAGSRSCDRSR